MWKEGRSRLQRVRASVKVAQSSRLTLERAAQFVKCDVTKWNDQLAMFKQAVANSPNKRVDIAIANAGIAGHDPVFFQNSI